MCSLCQHQRRAASRNRGAVHLGLHRHGWHQPPSGRQGDQDPDLPMEWLFQACALWRQVDGRESEHPPQTWTRRKRGREQSIFWNKIGRLFRPMAPTTRASPRWRVGLISGGYLSSHLQWHPFRQWQQRSRPGPIGQQRSTSRSIGWPPRDEGTTSPHFSHETSRIIAVLALAA